MPNPALEPTPTDPVAALYARVAALEQQVRDSSRAAPAQAYDFEPSEVSVATATGAAIDLGGPSVSLLVPEDGVVDVLWLFEGMIDAGTISYGYAQFTRDGVATSMPSTRVFSLGFNEYASSPLPVDLASGNTSNTGPLGRYNGGWLSFFETAGLHTYELRYRCSSGSTAASRYRNRRLAARLGR